MRPIKTATFLSSIDYETTTITHSDRLFVHRFSEHRAADSSLLSQQQPPPTFLIKVCIKPPTVRGAEEMRRRGHFRPQPLGLGPRLVPGPHLLLLLGHALHLDHVLPRDANLAVALLHRAARRLQRVTEVVSVRLSVTGGKGRRGADGVGFSQITLYTYVIILR